MQNPKSPDLTNYLNLSVLNSQIGSRILWILICRGLYGCDENWESCITFFIKIEDFLVGHGFFPLYSLLQSRKLFFVFSSKLNTAFSIVELSRSWLASCFSWNSSYHWLLCSFLLGVTFWKPGYFIFRFVKLCISYKLSHVQCYIWPSCLHINSGIAVESNTFREMLLKIYKIMNIYDLLLLDKLLILCINI